MAFYLGFQLIHHAPIHTRRAVASSAVPKPKLGVYAFQLLSRAHLARERLLMFAKLLSKFYLIDDLARKNFQRVNLLRVNRADAGRLRKACQARPLSQQ